MENNPNEHSLPTPGRRAWPEPVFVALSLIVSYLFCEFILFGGLGASVALFIAVFYAAALCYLARGGLRLSFGFVVTFSTVAFLCLCFLLYNNLELRFLNVLGLLIFIPLSLLYASGMNEYPFFSIGTIWDHMKTFLLFPFANIGKSAAVLAENGHGSKKVAGVLKILLGILIISPVALIIVLLLMRSDAAFDEIMTNSFRYITGRWLTYFFKILIAVVLTFPLFSLLYSLLHKQFDVRISKYGIGRRVRAVDTMFVNSALWVICMIYVLYISTQIGYFFSAFRNMLPDGYTSMAAYARRGFFELVAVVAINLCLIVFAMLFSKRSGDDMQHASKVTIFALSLLTVMLIITAISKMVMYIQNYGLTPLRVYTSWFMLALLVVFVLLIVRMFVPRFRFLRSSAVAVILLYLMLNFANTDALIPQYNIAKYRQDIRTNSSATLDVDMFDQLSDSMVPQAAALRNDAAYGKEVNKMLETRSARLKSQDWQNYTVAGALAERVIDGK